MSAAADLAALDGVRAFSGLARDDIAELLPAMTPFDVAADTELFRQGDPAGPLYILTHGAVELVVARAHDTELVARVDAGDIVGSFTHVSAPRSVSAITVEATAGFTLSRHAFVASLAALRPAAYSLMFPLAAALAARVRQLVERLAGVPTGARAAAVDLARWAVSEPGIRPDQLRELAAVAAFSPDELDRLLLDAVWLDIPRGEVIVTRGADNEFLALVVRGAVQGRVRSGPGDVVPLPLNIPGETIGEIALLDAGPHPATYRAREHSTLVQFAPGRFTELFDQQDAAAYRLLDVAVGTIERMLTRSNRRLVHVSVQRELRSGQ